MARFLAQRSGSDPGTVRVGFMKDRVSIERVVLTYLRFFSYLIIPPITYIILSTLQGTENGPARDSTCPDTQFNPYPANVENMVIY
jgi:hypothetical protein